MPKVTKSTRRAKLKVADTTDLLKLRRQIERYRDRYFNTDSPEVDDETYDALERKLKRLSPNDKLLSKVGAPVRTGRKVTLPFKMPSLDKTYPDRGADKWIDSNPKLTASDKLDGVSAQYINVDGVYKLYTRGNGSVGQDISALIPRISGLGTLRKGESCRLELVISKSNFSANWAKKFSNPRNTVSGVVNSADPKSPVMKDVLAVAHGMMNPKRPLAMSATYLKAKGFTVVYYKNFGSASLAELQEHLERRKKVSKFDIDGLVLESGTNQIAFKVNSEAKVGIVEEIEWTLSRNKILIPVVILRRPLQLSGVMVKRATAHNAKNVKNLGIGPGAEVYITRAGDVIPKIVGVKKKVVAQLPAGKWDSNRTHLIGSVTSKKDKDSVYVKRISESLRILGVPSIRSGLVTKLVEYGYKNILELFKGEDEDFQEAGLGPTQADILYTGLSAAKDKATHSIMMKASGVFPQGMGITRFDAINSHIPFEKMRASTNIRLFKQILAIPGFSEITAKQFVDSFDKYVTFINKLRWKPRVTKRKTNDTLSGVQVVFTGFRNRTVEEVIRSRGGKVGGSVNKKTTFLVVKDSSMLSTVKALKAKALGVKTITLDKLARSYGIQL